MKKPHSKSAIHKKVSTFLLAMQIVFCTVFFCGCSEKAYGFGLKCLDSVLSITTFDFDISNETENDIKTTAKNLKKEFSFGEDSFLTKFNSADVKATIPLSTNAKDILNKIKTCHDFTENYNPAVYPFLKMWHFTPDTTIEKADFIPPTQDAIDNAFAKYMFNPTALTFDDENNTVEKTENFQLDLGGIIKGFIADIITQKLKDAGHNSGYVDFGGSSINILSADSLSITHPEKLSENIIKIDDIKNKAVSTSGNYRTYYEYQGTKYAHIIDPKTGYPIDNGILSTVVFAENGWFADAMSTALMLCNKDNIKDLIEKLCDNAEYPVYSVFVIFNNGHEKSIFTNEDKNNFSLLDTNYDIITI